VIWARRSSAIEILIPFSGNLKTITANIITCKQKIGVMKPGTSSHLLLMAIVTLPPPVTLDKRHHLRLELPKFKRDVKNQPAFWGSFKSTFNENANIP